MRRRFKQATLTSLRDMASEDALAVLAIYYKPDLTYLPVKDPSSRRWHVCTPSGDFEILTTGPHRWYDVRAKRGGGGAIDLAMHLRQLSFVDAVRLLNECWHPRG